MKIIKYMIVHKSNYLDYNFSDFTGCINNFIKEGWQPFGGPFIDKENTTQAMVKYEEVK